MKKEEKKPNWTLLVLKWVIFYRTNLDSFFLNPLLKEISNGVKNKESKAKIHIIK